MENGVAQRSSEKSAKSRGRPARISRELILDNAARLAENAPGELPSMNGIARAMKISPMAIYTYFANKDELLQALSDRLLTDFMLHIPEDAEPLDAVIAWAHAMRAHVLANPQLVQVLVWEGGHTSVAWLERGMAVSEALGRMGFTGAARAQATLWVWHVAMGAINVELRNGDLPQNMTQQELASLDPATRGEVEQMLKLTFGAQFAEDFFAYQLDRMCEGLLAMKDEMATAS